MPVVCHLLASHCREGIAYGPARSDRERHRPVGDTGRHEPATIDAILDGELQRAPDDHLLSANDERDSREVDGSPVVREELSERPGSQSRRPDGIRMRGCAERDSDRKLVGADGVRAVPVIPAPEIAAQPVVDNRAKFLHSVKHLPGRVATLATQRDACAVPGPRGLGRRRVLILRQGGHRAARESRTQRHARAYGFDWPYRQTVSAAPRSCG
jgi:hypothetical protein